jgi:hypothetical protein
MGPAMMDQVFRVSEFELSGHRLRLSCATKADLSAVKDLDDACFQPHRGSTEQEIEAVFSNGLIVLIHHDNNLVAMTQLVLRCCPLLYFELADDEMFSYGTGIHSTWRGSGLSDILMKIQKDVALSSKK